LEDARNEDDDEEEEEDDDDEREVSLPYRTIKTLNEIFIYKEDYFLKQITLIKILILPLYIDHDVFHYWMVVTLIVFACDPCYAYLSIDFKLSKNTILYAILKIMLENETKHNQFSTNNNLYYTVRTLRTYCISLSFEI